MTNSRQFLFILRSINWAFLVVSVVVTICSALAGAKLFYDLIFVLKYVLVSGPAVLDLLMITFSFYLMLDGVYRWGMRKDGAFSRTLIGLFILHTSSVELPYVPYIALLLEFALCIRNAQINARKESGLDDRCSSTVFSGSYLET